MANKPASERTPTTKVSTTLLLAPPDFAACAASQARRNFPNRAEYLRWLIRQDAAGNLLLVDHAVEKLVSHLVAGFGSAVGYLSAEMEARQLEIARDDARLAARRREGR